MMDTLLYVPLIDAILWTLGYALLGGAVGAGIVALLRPRVK